MADRGNRPPNEELPILRRDFLKLGAAGAAIDPKWLDSSTNTDGVDVSERASNGAALASLRPPPTAQDFLPPKADFISVRGIAPDLNTAQGSAVWLSNQQFSVANLVSTQGIDRRPVSVRELTTPQRLGPEPQLNSILEADNPLFPMTFDSRAEPDPEIPQFGSDTWENWLGDYEQKNTDEFLFGDRKQLLQTVVRKAEKEFRAVGSGHSHSEAAKPGNAFSNVKSLSGKISNQWLKPIGDEFWSDIEVTRDNLIRLKAGTVIKKLNRDILPQEGLALPNMGSWDGQTLAGAVNTSTHGTGLGMGTFADLVRSVEIITVPRSLLASGTPLVRMLRVEPSNGITDPERFAKATNEHDMALVQDDDLFHSIVVGYGSMGVVYAYTLELENAYWLKEVNTIKQWGSFDPYQEAQQHRHYNFLVDLAKPQIRGITNPTCLVRTRDKVQAPGRMPTERANTDNIAEKVFYKIHEDVMDEFVNDTFLGAIAEVFATLPETVLKAYAQGAPFDGGRQETASYIALRRRKARFPDKPDKPPEPPTDTITTDIGVPAEDVESAVNAVINLVQNTDLFFPVPLGVRFTDGSPHYFSPEYNRKTAMLEFSTPVPEKLGTNLAKVEVGKVYVKPKKIVWQKQKKFLNDFNMPYFYDTGLAKNELETVQDMLVSRFDGRPHMGKHNTVRVYSNKDDLKPQEMYQKYNEWEDTHRYFNSFGTFDSEFTGNKTRS